MGAVGALVGLLLLAGALVVGDRMVEDTAEDRASDRVSSAIAAPAQVDLRGWPMTLALLRNRVPEVRVTAEQVPVPPGEARLSHLRVVLHDVAVGFGEPQTSALPPSSGGTFSATLDEAAVRALADIPDVLPLELQLREGLLRVSVAGFSTVDAEVFVRDGVVHFAPVRALPGVPTIAMPLESLPAGARVDAVRVDADRLRLEGTIPAT